MESIYDSMKVAVEANENPRVIQTHPIKILKYLEKMKEMSEKFIDKSIALLQRPFGMRHERENKNFDIEKTNILNANFCEVKVDTKTDLKPVEKETAQDAEPSKL